MKAYTLHGINDLRYGETAMPECSTGWCIVQVKAAGICSSDIPRIYTKGTYHFPTIPGHEYSGIVVKVADPADSPLVGKHVAVFPLIPCKTCCQCQQEHYEMCSNYDYTGSRRDGAFAEYVAVPTWNLLEIPDTVSFEEAALMEPLSVAKHAIDQCTVTAGDKVAIIGSGMIAFAAAQWALKFGAAEVCVIGRSENKRELAERIHGITYLTDLADRDAYNVVLEAVGTNDAISKSIDAAKHAGRIVLMGNPEGNIVLEQSQYWKILRKQLHITGTWNSRYLKDVKCDWTDARDALVDKSIQAQCLISHVFSQDNLTDGLELMRNKREPYTKVMTIWNREGGENR